jgi:hypothetical protein
VDLKTKLDLLLDGHYNLARRFDHMARIVPIIHDVPVAPSLEHYPPRIVAAVTQHWLTHVLEAAKPLLPGIYNFRLFEFWRDTVTNVVTTSAATAAMLRVAIDLVAHASQSVGANSLESSTGPRFALRLYSLIYPTIRNALISIAQMPGPWCRDSKAQRQATDELKSFLIKLVLDANLNNVSVTLGDPFIGFAKTPNDRWLPTIQWGGAQPEDHHILLTTPPLSSLDDIDIHMCRHPAIQAWQQLLVRKFPFLALDSTPLYAEPKFPCPWTTHPSTAKNIAHIDITIRSTGAESAETLLSWIGRSMLSSSLREDEEATHQCAADALIAYIGMRIDLCSAIDTTLRGEIAHGMTYIPSSLITAARYIDQVLERLAELAEGECTFMVYRKSELSVANAEADDWMPRVNVDAQTFNEFDANAID